MTKIKNLLLLAVFAVFLFSGCRDKAYQYVEKAPDSFREIIAEGLTEDLKVRNCFTVPAKNYPDSHYVAGELYGEEFIWNMARALKPGGKYSFYTGDPYSKGKGRNFIGGIVKRLKKNKLPGEYRNDLFSIVGHCSKRH